MDEKEKKIVSKAMSILARIKTPKTAERSRKNGRLGGRPRKNPSAPAPKSSTNK